MVVCGFRPAFRIAKAQSTVAYTSRRNAGSLWPIIGAATNRALDIAPRHHSHAATTDSSVTFIGSFEPWTSSISLRLCPPRASTATAQVSDSAVQQQQQLHRRRPLCATAADTARSRGRHGAAGYFKNGGGVTQGARGSRPSSSRLPRR